MSARKTASTSVSWMYWHPEFGGIAALKVGAQQIGSVAAGGQPQCVAIPPPTQAQVLEADFHVSPGLLVTLFESAQMEKNLAGVFEPPMAKEPPQPDQIAHQAAHDPPTHRAFFLRPRPAAGQHVGFAYCPGR